MESISEPFAKVEIDTEGEIFPNSSAGHKFILTLVDCVIWWCEAIPLRNIKTETCADALMLIGFLTRMGFPKTILLDCESHLTISLMAEVKKLIQS